MGLGSVTEDIIRRVEEASERPVSVQADPTLTTLATVRMARGSMPAHFVLYNPRLGPDVDYIISYQCGFILRVFETPPLERFDVAASYRGRKDVDRLLADHVRTTGLGLSRESRDQLRDQLYDGLMRQLRSISVGLRVDDWLRRDYPQLAEQQRSVAARQLNENTGSLRPEIKRMAPPKIVTANVTMNAAFAAYWADLWQDPLPLQPYRAAGLADAGAALLQAWREVPAEPTHDRDLVASWGERLGLQDWFELIPFPSPS